MTAEPKSELSPELAAINEAEPRDALNEILKHALAKSASDLFILSNATHYVVSIRRLGARTDKNAEKMPGFHTSAKRRADFRRMGSALFRAISD